MWPALLLLFRDQQHWNKTRKTLKVKGQRQHGKSAGASGVFVLFVVLADPSHVGPTPSNQVWQGEELSGKREKDKGGSDAVPATSSAL